MERATFLRGWHPIVPRCFRFLLAVARPSLDKLHILCNLCINSCFSLCALPAARAVRHSCCCCCSLSVSAPLAGQRCSAALLCLPWLRMLLVCAVLRLLDATACTTILPCSCVTIWQVAVVGVRGAQHQVPAGVLIPVCADTVVPLQHTQQTFRCIVANTAAMRAGRQRTYAPMESSLSWSHPCCAPASLCRVWLNSLWLLPASLLHTRCPSAHTSLRSCQIAGTACTHHQQQPQAGHTAQSTGCGCSAVPHACPGVGAARR